MNSKIARTINLIGAGTALLVGSFLLVFAAFFLITGHDELWNGRVLWIYGWFWLCTLLVDGLLMLNYFWGWKKVSFLRFVSINAVLFGALGTVLIFDL
ncbi:hypothetical protein JW899_04625 [Candidatus Uhrbacteria bacterium]|nr:hypothetical protein [Candidatus Uhrbacteria bacterium]